MSDLTIEFAKEIEKASRIEGSYVGGPYYEPHYEYTCAFCGASVTGPKSIKHGKHCIALKAIKYIEENKDAIYNTTT